MARPTDIIIRFKSNFDDTIGNVTKGFGKITKKEDELEKRPHKLNLKIVTSYLEKISKLCKEIDESVSYIKEKVKALTFQIAALTGSLDLLRLNLSHTLNQFLLIHFHMKLAEPEMLKYVVIAWNIIVCLEVIKKLTSTIAETIKGTRSPTIKKKPNETAEVIAEVKKLVKEMEKGSSAIREAERLVCDKSKRTTKSVKRSMNQLKEEIVQKSSSISNTLKRLPGTIGQKFKAIGTVLIDTTRVIARGMMGFITEISSFMAANPIIAIIMAIIAAVVLLYAAWKTDFGGIREKTRAVIDFIKERISGIKQVFLSVVKGVKSFYATIMKIWENIKSFLQNPIKATMNIASNIIGKITGHNALGTSYWHGGSTVVGEYGPEVVDLPSGSRVYDTRASRGFGGGINIAKLADKIIVREDADIDRIADSLVRKLKIAGYNAV